MATSIALNGTYINTGNYHITRILHDSSPVLDINSLELARRDGSILISTNFKNKEIQIEGWIQGTSQANLEANLDTLKGIIVRPNIALDIAYAGGTRRYVVTCNNFSITRESSDVTHCRYSASYMCLTPFGISPTEQEALSVTGLVSNAGYNTTVTFDGSAQPDVSLMYTINTAGNLDEIVINNLTGGQQVAIGTAWEDGDVLMIDSLDRTVQLNGNDVEFEGVFPEFDAGINNVQTILASSGGTILSQPLADGFSNPIYSTTNWVVQSFTAPSTINCSAIAIIPTHYWGISQSITVSVETDDTNKPSGTLANANAIKTLTVTSSNTWVVFTFPVPFQITNATKYWITIKSPLATNTEYLTVRDSWANPVIGNEGDTNDSGANYTLYTPPDISMIIYNDDTPTYSIDWEINYYPRYL